MAASGERVVEHLNACAGFLASVAVSMRAEACRRQLPILIRLIGDCELSLGQAAECNAKLQAMQWPPEELASLQASVIASVNRAPISKTQGAVR